MRRSYAKLPDKCAGYHRPAILRALLAAMTPGNRFSTWGIDSVYLGRTSDTWLLLLSVYGAFRLVNDEGDPSGSPSLDVPWRCPFSRSASSRGLPEG